MLSSIIKFCFLIIQLGHCLMINRSLVFLFGNILRIVRKSLYRQFLLSFYFRSSFNSLFEYIIYDYIFIYFKRLSKIWLLDLFRREKASISVQIFCCFLFFVHLFFPVSLLLGLGLCSFVFSLQQRQQKQEKSLQHLFRTQKCYSRKKILSRKDHQKYM